MQLILIMYLFTPIYPKYYLLYYGINIKLINPTSYILFFHTKSSNLCVFHRYSTSQYGVATL